LVFADLSGEDFEVRVEAGDHSARRLVSTYMNPKGPAPLFRDAARRWKGWKGTKDWQSLEGELRLELTTDRTGHVVVDVEVRADYGGPDPWRLNTQITLEAGQLETISHQMQLFFARA
jgi:hypothetical protein